MDKKFWLPGTPATHAYFERRQRVGIDPFPVPQTEREEIIHKLWWLGIAVAGWWLEETSVLRDMLQKYEQTQAEEAMQMQREREARLVRQAAGPTRAQISEGLRDIYSHGKARREGRRRLYPASGLEALR